MREDWEDGEERDREGQRTREHTGEEKRQRGRRRKGREQCWRTEPEALKLCVFENVAFRESM